MLGLRHSHVPRLDALYKAAGSLDQHRLAGDWDGGQNQTEVPRRLRTYRSSGLNDSPNDDPAARRNGLVVHGDWLLEQAQETVARPLGRAGNGRLQPNCDRGSDGQIRSRWNDRAGRRDPRPLSSPLEWKLPSLRS